MYTVGVRRDFIARHMLIGGDWGPENESHAHYYLVEARLYGKKLDRHGYLLDICEVETHLEFQGAWQSGLLHRETILHSSGLETSFTF